MDGTEKVPNQPTKDQIETDFYCCCCLREKEQDISWDVRIQGLQLDLPVSPHNSRMAGNLVLTALQSVRGPSLLIILSFSYAWHVLSVWKLCQIPSPIAAWL